MSEATGASRRVGAELRVPAFLAYVAEAHRRCGRPARALEVIAEALDLSRRYGQHYWDAELHRARGEMTDAPAEAESCFLEAIAVSRRQRARSFELRAATSLGRLWAREGRVHEARDRLAEVLAWFAEGFDAPDLEDARALIGPLGP